jgi:riboflavin kinase/FMN adenylyltransferase
MKIFYSLDHIRVKKHTIVTVGSFDGIHLGHQHILKELEKQSRDCDCVETLITFHPHPKEVLGNANKNSLELLTPLEEKLEILEAFGLPQVIVIPFTLEFSRMTYQDFVKEILLKKIRMKKIVIGYDHTFGRNREGHAEQLQKLGKSLGFKVTVMPPYYVGDEAVSSSHIRRYVKEGKMENARILLGRPYSLSGQVVKGENRGKQLGFPTANIQLADSAKLIPAKGVYAVNILFEGKKYSGMMNIGTRPTFNFDPLTLEVHIFNFSGLIYGFNLKILFKAFIRKEIKFSSPEKLQEQMRKDREQCIKL